MRTRVLFMFQSPNFTDLFLLEMQIRFPRHPQSSKASNLNFSPFLFFFLSFGINGFLVRGIRVQQRYIASLYLVFNLAELEVVISKIHRYVDIISFAKCTSFNCQHCLSQLQKKCHIYSHCEQNHCSDDHLFPKGQFFDNKAMATLWSFSNALWNNLNVFFIKLTEIY